MTRNQYDVVVVGAGLGGLSAATFLAQQGLGVLLLERHNVPGGYATSFVRGRFEFEVALHELSGIGPPGRPGPLLRHLEEIGVADRIELVRLPELYRSVFPDLDLTLPTGWEAFEQVLCDAFPHEAAGLRRFLGRIRKLFTRMAPIYELIVTGKRPSPLDLGRMMASDAGSPRYIFATWGEVLDREVQDPRARAVLSQLWGYFGLPPAEISYMLFANALGSYIDGGATHIRGRSQALSSAFVDAFEAHGGELRLGCGVDRIHVRGGRVIGVVTEHGDAIGCDWVVTNADPVTTCLGLVGAEHFPDRFLRRLRQSTVGFSSFNVYLGLAESPEALGLTDHEVFVNRDHDIEAHFRSGQRIGAPEEIALTSYTAVMPDISPPGTTLAVLCSLVEGAPWYDVPPTEYVATKNRVASAMLDLAETVTPGLRDAAEVVEVSTPVTNMRYGGQVGGSIYGQTQPPNETAMFRLPHRSPLPGLYFAGAWTMPGGGFEPAMISGRMAGEMVLSRAGRGRKGVA